MLAADEEDSTNKIQKAAAAAARSGSHTRLDLVADPSSDANVKERASLAPMTERVNSLVQSFVGRTTVSDSDDFHRPTKCAPGTSRRSCQILIERRNGRPGIRRSSIVKIRCLALIAIAPHPSHRRRNRGHIKSNRDRAMTPTIRKSVPCAVFTGSNVLEVSRGEQFHRSLHSATC